MTDPTTTAPEPAREHPEPDIQSDATMPTAAEQRRVSEFATHGDPTLSQDDADPVSRRAGVQWVRPTDLAARAGGAVVERGMDLNTQLRDAVLEGVRSGRAQLAARLAARQTQLDPETVPTRTPERSSGRTGVSR